MNIHEYQAKRLLYGYGAPIASGVAVYSVEQAEEWAKKLPGSLYVVKSQIHAGGRGQGRFKELGEDSQGGIRICHSVEEVAANAKEMLGHCLVTKQTGEKGKKVQRLYIEEGTADIERELYLSLLVDRAAGKISFVASQAGGMDIETVAANTPEKILTLDVDYEKGLTEADLTTLSSGLQLEGDTKLEAEKLFKQLYKVFNDKDMSLLEINPLVVRQDGHLRVLDSKISFDNNALYRHPDIMKLRDISEEDPKEIEASKHDLSYIALDGDIGCMVNGAGLAMATMDIIKLYDGSPANFLDVGGSATEEKVAAAFRIILQDPQVKGILVNIFGGIMRCDIIAKGVVQAAKDMQIKVPLIVRLEGTNVGEGKEILAQSGLDIISADDLDQAAYKIVNAVKGA